jgi:hypothetical protein
MKYAPNLLIVSLIIFHFTSNELVAQHSITGHGFLEQTSSEIEAAPCNPKVKPCR